MSMEGEPTIIVSVSEPLFGLSRIVVNMYNVEEPVELDLSRLVVTLNNVEEPVKLRFKSSVVKVVNDAVDVKLSTLTA